MTTVLMVVQGVMLALTGLLLYLIGRLCVALEEPNKAARAEADRMERICIELNRTLAGRDG